MKTLCNSLIVAAVLAVPGSALPYDYDAAGTEKLMMQLIADIGGHGAIARNSGKALRCGHGGTRKITIVRGKGKTSYRGEYLNCNQNGSIRDGIFEIVLKGDEVVKSSARRSKNGELFDAAMVGDSRRMGKLIKARADVNYSEGIENADGGTIEQWTPLMSAVARGDMVSVRMLVKAGAWINYLNGLAVSALWIAANNGHGEIVTYLAEHGANVNNSNYEDVTPLMAAAMNGHGDALRRLVAAGAQLNRVHREGSTALMFSLMGRHTAVARLLIEAGADVNTINSSGINALHIAAAEGELEVTKLLVERGVDPAVRTPSGKTALDVARERGNTAVADFLAKQ